MVERPDVERELSIGSDGVSLKGTAYDDFRLIIKGAVGVATPFFELLANLSGLSFGWINRKLAKIGSQYEDKLTKVPEEHRQLPPLEIAASVVRGASISSDSPELQELFSELLASASDSRRVKSTHPSFGSIICELEPLDAQILSIFRQIGKGRQPKISRADVHKVFEESNFHFGGELLKKEDLETAVSNLIRQGIVERSSFNYNAPVFRDRGGYSRDNRNSHIAINDLREELTEAFRKLANDPWPLRLTPIGERFVASCVPGSEISRKPETGKNEKGGPRDLRDVVD